MLGAIIGDIVGSRWEFNPTNDYNFEFFSNENSFTDDTICTVAVADALLKGRDYGESIHEWCRRYPHPMGGYGGRFAGWVHSENPQPYGSYGNGAAMRVSPVAMWFQDTQEAKQEAERTAACTHNHPEGLKGAAAVAEAINMAIHTCYGKTPDEQTDLAGEIGIATAYNNKYDHDINIDAVRNRFDETCQGTVPVALYIITESTSFEDAIRRAVSLGADADTLGAIVGSIAEHIWGIPEWMKEKVRTYLREEMLDVLDRFYDKVGYHPDREIDFNKFMENCINWMLPGLQFYYRDTDAIDNADEIYKVGETIRAGFFIDVTTKLLRPIHKTRYIIASAHVAPFHEIKDIVEKNPAIAEWNLCTLHYNSYFKVMDIYKKEGVTQVFLLHIPENMARLLREDFNMDFVDEALGENNSLKAIARASLDEKMKMDVHPRSLDPTWCERMEAPVGLTAEGDFFPLEPLPDSATKAASLGHSIRKMANDFDVEIPWRKNTKI